MKRIVVLLLVLSLLAGLLPASGAGERELRISDEKGLRALAEACVLDRYSHGLTVRLTADIDLGEEEFSPIPLFAGLFDGQGHEIRGLKLTEAASTQGLFRQVLAGAVVQDLKVSGLVQPAGEAAVVGGLAGRSQGTLLRCTFTGTVEGGSAVGGIVGRNEGTVEDCAVSGSVVGQHRVGGIAGENSGLILGSSSGAEVTGASLSGLTVGDLELTLSPEEIVDITDMGGIAGFSSGEVRECVNEGAVGHLHVGYNVGGVVGRQSGVVADCRSLGSVRGRKDVGGIVGQLDPDARWSFSGSTLERLRDSLGQLQGEIGALTEDAARASGAVSAGLTEALAALDGAADAADAVAKEASDWAAENLEVVNELSRRVSDALGELEPVCRSLEGFTDALAPAADSFSRAFDALGQSALLSEGALHDAGEAASDLEAAFTEGRAAAGELASGLAHLRSALGDPAEAQMALGELSEGLGLLASFRAAAARELEELLAALDALLGELKSLAGEEIYRIREDTEPYLPEEEDLSRLLELLRDLVRAVRDLLAQGPQDLDTVLRAFRDLHAGTAGLLSLPDLAEFHAFLVSLESSLGDLGQLSEDLAGAASDARGALEGLQAAAPALEEALSLCARGLDSLEDAFGQLDGAAEGVHALSRSLAAGEPLTLTLPQGESEGRQALLSSLHAASAALSGVTERDDGSVLAGDLRAVTNRLFAMTELVMNALPTASGGEERISLEDVSAGHQLWSAGRAEGCENTGDVEGETNVGGVVGAITIDLELERAEEADLSSLLSGRARYLIYASVRACRSAGNVSARRQAAGGIVGCMDYGAVQDCEATGDIRSAGQYAGGIAGLSYGTVERCRARTELTGDGYVGGIAGLGHDVRDCLAMPWLETKGEYRGSVAGEADGAVSGNRYSCSTLGGVNGFSFAGQAEPVTYEELLRLSDAALFRTVTVTLRAEGETLEVREVPFGGRIGTLPTLPDKEGQQWQWDEEASQPMYHGTTVEGRYVRPITTLSTGEEVPLFLAQGVFRQGQKLLVRETEPILAAIEGQSVPIAWTVSVTDYAGKLTVRLRETREGTLWLRDVDGQLREETPERDGSYLVFSMYSGAAVSFLPGRTPRHRHLLLGGIGAGAVLAGGLALLLLRRRKRRRDGKGQTDGEGGEGT